MDYRLEKTLARVKEALQPVEEMGGIKDDQEYCQLMRAIITECEQRIHANQEARGMPWLDMVATTRRTFLVSTEDYYAIQTMLRGGFCISSYIMEESEPLDDNNEQQFFMILSNEEAMKEIICLKEELGEDEEIKQHEGALDLLEAITDKIHEIDPEQNDFWRIMEQH